MPAVQPVSIGQPPASSALVPADQALAGETKLRRVAVLALGFTLAVILWGAFVRVTGSGAGCGSHWPTCNGEVIPRAPAAATIVEYTHRLTSGVALLLALLTVVLAFVWLPRGHDARRRASWSLFFMLTEAAIGAGLVLFEMVAHNRSVARGAWMSAHLVNTFLLLAAQATTVFAVTPHLAAKVAAPPWVRTASRAALGALLLVGVTGAIAALGDTLFPSTSLVEGLSADMDSGAHLFLRLRAAHPFLAAITAVAMIVGSGAVMRAVPALRKHAQLAVLLAVGQVGLGLVNLLMLAPAALQLIHLALADALWIATVLVAFRSRA